jgi:hypothetical protein
MVELGRNPDLPQKPFGAQLGRDLLPEDLDGDRTIVPDVLGQVDGRHPPTPDLTLEHVAVAEGVGWEGRVEYVHEGAR